MLFSPLLRLVPDIPPVVSPPRGSGVIDYPALLGEAAWRRLPEALRRRFDQHLGHDVTYVGVMRRVWLSPGGRLLAALCRLLGEPLVAASGTDVPTHVRVFHAADGATVWERAYHFPGRVTRTVRSTKRAAADGTLFECLPLGLRMRLVLHEHDGELLFVSSAYEWRLGPLRVGLPGHWLPGRTVVGHRDLGDGRFRFRLQITHPWLGSLVEQEGVFHEQEPL